MGDVITTVGAMMDAIKQASDMERPERPRLRGNVHYIPTEFETRLRMMIHFVARQEARQAVIRRLKAEGKVRVSLMSASAISRLANEHLRQHSAELLAQAEASGAVQRLMRDEAAKSERGETSALSPSDELLTRD